MDIEKLIKRKCKEVGISPDILTEEERDELITCENRAAVFCYHFPEVRKMM